MFFVPMPAWVLGVILIAMDLYGAISRADSNVAYIVHLTGAAFAFLYFRFHWNFGKWMPSRWPLGRFGSGPKLRIHVC